MINERRRQIINDASRPLLERLRACTAEVVSEHNR